MALSCRLVVGFYMFWLPLKGSEDLRAKHTGPTPGSHRLGLRLWFNLSMWQALFIRQGDFLLASTQQK